VEQRLIVAQPAGPSGSAPLAAAAMLYQISEDERVRWRLTLIAKAAYAFGPAGDGSIGEALAPRAPLAASLARKSELPGAAGEDAYPDDFIPEKARVDVLLTGHAYAERPAERLDASLALGEARRSFALIAGGPARALPLSSAYLRDPSGGPALPVGPLPSSPFYGLYDLDAERFAVAVDAQRTDAVEPGAELELVGLSPRAPRRTLRLPAFEVRAMAVSRMGENIPLVMRCDTVWVDTDREELVLVWRGAVPLAGDDALATIVRVDLWTSPLDDPPALEDVRRALQRGIFAYALEQDEAERGVAPPPIPEEELRAAKLSLWEQSPEGTLSFQRYAQISAELQEKREPRAETLRRHGLDEDGWGLEERAVMEGLAAAAMRGDAMPAQVFGDLFLAAQEALAAPEEASRGVAEYAPVKAAMEAGADPAKVLAHFDMTLPVWMRLDRRMTRAAATDPHLREAIEAATARAEVDPRLLDDEAAFADALARAEEDEEDDA
jgi:hypothetical protein